MRALTLLVIGVLPLLPLSASAAFGEDGRGRVPARSEHVRRQATPSSDATLYEVTETVRFDPVDGVTVTVRDAIATLLGSANIGTPLCPATILVATPSARACTIIGQGQDAVSLLTGQGPVWGTFAVVVEAPGNSSVHIPDLPVLTGTFSGSVDLSTAPLGSLNGGTLTIDQTGQTVGFSGTFRLPFAIDNAGYATHAQGGFVAAYYLADDQTLMWVTPYERALGFPLVRLEIHFAQ
jgi:hypothetical protein